MKDNRPSQFPSKKHYTPIVRKNTVKHYIRISHAMIEARSIAHGRICRPSIQPCFSEPQSQFVILRSSYGSGGTDQAQPDTALASPTAVANPWRMHGDRAKAGHDHVAVLHGSEVWAQ